LNPKFRNAANGRYLKGLFYETTGADKSSVSYSLKDWDHSVDGTVYPSLYRLYLELEDLTEYTFANTYLDGWEHWEMLSACNWFRPYAERWRKELSLKVKAVSLNRLKAEAASSSKNAFLANRYLIDKGWVEKDSKAYGRGRPSKDEVKAAAEEIAVTERRLDADYERLKDLN
jgi:predicted transcriptional regulator